MRTLQQQDSTLKAAILLNPAVAFLDSLNCPAETGYYCLIEEHLDHDVPVLIFAGEFEFDELISPGDSVYVNMWALPQYEYVPETTDKLYFESAGEGHGSSSFPNDDVAEFALAWLKKYLLNNESYCAFLIEPPQSISQFMTTLDCNAELSYDLNGDGEVDNADLILIITSIINGEGIQNQGNFNFDQTIDIFDLLMMTDYIDSF